MSQTGRLKVAFVHQPWSIVVPPMQVADSVAIWVDEVARRLADSCDVICYSRRNKDQPPGEVFEGVTYRRFAAPLDRAVRFLRLLDEWKLVSPRRGFLSSKWFYRQYIGRVADDLRREQPDIVHVESFSQYVPVIRAACPRAKIVLHMHSEWLTEYDPALIAPRIREADSIISCSNYFRDSNRAGWPQYAGRCQTVYNGVTLDEFTRTGPRPQRPAGAKRLLFVGRVCPDKGTHVLVEAFEKVLERFPAAELKIVGPIQANSKAVSVNVSRERAVQDLAKWYGRPYVPQLEGLMSELGRRQIEITGEVSRSRLIDHYRDADLLVLPSIYAEGFGIPIAEAAALGVPTVASRRGGVPEVVVNGETGLLVEPGDVDALAAAIVRLLESEELLASMGRAARARVVQCFTWERVAESLLAEYRRFTGWTSGDGEAATPPGVPHAPKAPHGLLAARQSQTTSLLPANIGMARMMEALGRRLA